jgi:hypothetical protein
MTQVGCQCRSKNAWAGRSHDASRGLTQRSRFRIQARACDAE